MEVPYKDTRKTLPVHEIPLNFLIYNKYNGRIASMVKSFERQHRQRARARLAHAGPCGAERTGREGDLRKRAHLGR